MPDPALLARLEADGLVLVEGGAARTSRRFQAALARAASRLQAAGAPFDLRLPIAAALLELDGALDDEEIARRVEALLPIEAAALGGAGPERPSHSAVGPDVPPRGGA